jgi:Tfp pilus assembly protein PilO
MSDETSPLDVLKTTPVVITIVIAVVVVIVWLLAFLLPEGSKISTLNTQAASLQAKVTAGNAEVAHLRKEALHKKTLVARLSTLQTYVPTKPEIYTYLKTITLTAKASKVTLVSISPSAELPPSTGQKFAAIPVSVSVKGTYDDILAFTANLYALPRLTDITTMSITGGGSGTAFNRASSLSANFALEVFTANTSSSSTPPA